MENVFFCRRYLEFSRLTPCKTYTVPISRFLSLVLSLLYWGGNTMHLLRPINTPPPTPTSTSHTHPRTHTPTPTFLHIPVPLIHSGILVLRSFFTTFWKLADHFGPALMTLASHDAMNNRNLQKPATAKSCFSSAEIYKTRTLRSWYENSILIQKNFFHLQILK